MTEGHKKQKLDVWKLSTFILAAALLIAFVGKGDIINFGDKGTVAVPTGGDVVAPTGGAIDLAGLADDDPFLGEDDAAVTIVEFSDFQCPFCKRFHEQTLDQIKTNYIDTGKVKFVYRDFPLGFHPFAQAAGEAGECAKEQGKFWEYHDKIFQNQASLSNDGLKQWAADIDLDTDKFNGCLDSGKYKQEVQKDFSDGQKLGVSGTPTFFVNGVKLVGAQPYSAFDAAIKAAEGGKVGTLQAAPPPTPTGAAAAGGCGIPPSGGSAPAPTAAKVENVNIEGDPALGEDNAPVVIVEFSDFQCPFCKRFRDQTFDQIKTKYIDTGKVKFVYRDYPLSFHPQAKPSALAAECADDQGKFWEYHDKIFENQASLSDSNYKAWASELGLDTEKFNGCLDSAEHSAEVDEDFKEGSSYGVTGTPGFLVNGIPVKGAQPYSVFEQLIEKELAK